jgi:3-oxoacyl-[acyl-carrier-protein] synthase II
MRTMGRARDIVITGLGAVTPLGAGVDAFWQALVERRSGVRRLPAYDGRLPVCIGAEIVEFDPKQYVRPRKSLKVMSREIQIAFAAADMACQQAGATMGAVDPERLGVVFGADMIYCEPLELEAASRKCLENGGFNLRSWADHAMSEMYPLWLLKYLPNMPACHIAIANDARSHNNSITLGEVSSIIAMAEAMRVIERGQADLMITGGTGNRLHPMYLSFRNQQRVSQRCESPELASRPFDRDRDGLVDGEGSAAMIIERQDHAERRGARPLARVLSYASCVEPLSGGKLPTGTAIRGSIGNALKSAGLQPDDLDHVCANGLSTVEHDRSEAQAIRDVLGDLPVVALKSYFGSLGAAAAAVEMLASVLGIQHSAVPGTLNYEHPDPHCPVNVVSESRPQRKPNVLLLSQTTMGQAAAVVLSAVV